MTDFNSALFLETSVAGVGYHEASTVWDELKVGVPLELLRDNSNAHDSNAVAVAFRSPRSGQTYVIGYIPKEQNAALAALLDMGWEAAFDTRLAMVDPGARYEQQLRVCVRVRRRHKF